MLGNGKAGPVQINATFMIVKSKAKGLVSLTNVEC